jgi:AcrR family transcriptional regulator
MADHRRRHHDATRREILDAAWALAEESGVAGISLRALAGAVGMQAPSLYTYFPSKDAIYDAMFAEGYRALDAHYARWERGFDGSDRIGALSRAAAEFVAFCQESPARYQLMFTRAVPGWEPSPDAYGVSLAGYRRAATALARLGIEGERALDLFTAMTAGLAAQQMANDPDGDRWRRLAGDAVRMLLAHLEDRKDAV